LLEDVIILQQIFFTSLSPEKYARQGENFEFPVPETCPNPACTTQKAWLLSEKLLGFYLSGQDTYSPLLLSVLR